MAIAILNDRRLVVLSPQQAIRFKAIKDGKAIPTPFEQSKADLIAKIYLGKQNVYPQEVRREAARPQLPYKDD